MAVHTHLFPTFQFTLLWRPLQEIKGFPGNSAGKKSTYNSGGPGLIPGWGSSPDKGIGYPLQHSWDSLVAQAVKNPPAMGKPGFYPWDGKMPQGRA